MIEAYAFLAMFVAQIVAMSVLYPARFIDYFRAQWAKFPAERLQDVYPGVDLDLAAQRFVARYRILNTIIAVLGLMLFAWLFNYVQQPGWGKGRLAVSASMYFMLQVAPILFIALIAMRYRNIVRPLLLETRRKATLQRRDLFDFVSPGIVIVTAMGYFLLVGFILYAETQIEQDPLSLSEYFTIGGITAIYLVNAIVVYAQIYGKRPNPMDSNTDRIRATGITVKACVYSCLLCVVYLAFNFTLDLVNLDRWAPFAMSTFFVACALLTVMSVSQSKSPQDEAGLDQRPAH